MNRYDFKVVRWLHVRGGLYSRAGNFKQSMACLLVAIQLAPDNKAVLRTLAAIFLKVQDGHRAMKAIDRLSQLEGDLPIHDLMRSHALWLQGSKADAKTVFNQYVSRTSD